MGETTKPILHRIAQSKNQLLNDVGGTCGARRDGGGRFTTNSKIVNCPACRVKINEQRALAKARFAALNLG